VVQNCSRALGSNTSLLIGGSLEKGCLIDSNVLVLCSTRQEMRWNEMKEQNNIVVFVHR